jgi:hypothetical protein
MWQRVLYKLHKIVHAKVARSEGYQNLLINKARRVSSESTRHEVNTCCRHTIKVTKTGHRNMLNTGPPLKYLFSNLTLRVFQQPKRNSKFQQSPSVGLILRRLWNSSALLTRRQVGYLSGCTTTHPVPYSDPLTRIFILLYNRWIISK